MTPGVPRRGLLGGSFTRVGRPRDERGAALVMVAAGGLLLCLLGAAAVLIAGYVVAEEAARGAADLAALSGARAFALGGDACAAADRIATANRARLRACSIRGDPVHFVVAVEVTRPVPAAWSGLPDEVAAQASAGRRE